MKYTLFGFSQRKSIEIGLDLTDILILRFIVDFYPSMNKKIINSKEYGWISYNYLLQEIPIISTKQKSSLFKRIKKLEEKKLIERECVKDDTGTYSYVRLTENMGGLISDGGGYSSRDIPVSPESKTKDSSIKDSSYNSFSFSNNRLCDAKKEKKEKNKNFPSEEEIKSYAKTKGYNNFDSKKFWEINSMKGWEMAEKLGSWQKLVDIVSKRDDYKKQEETASKQDTLAVTDTGKEIKKLVVNNWGIETYISWFASLIMKDENVIVTDNGFVCDYIRNNFLSTINRTLKKSITIETNINST